MSHLDTPPVRKLVPLTAQSSSLRSASAVVHHKAEQYLKNGRTKPLRHPSRSHRSWNAHQDFKVQIPLEATLETERRCFSYVILKWNVTPNLSMSPDSLCTVLPIVNESDKGWIVRDQENYHSLGLTRIQFDSHRSHHSLTLLVTGFGCRPPAVPEITPGCSDVSRATVLYNLNT